MKIVIIASMAHKEFKSAIYLKEFLFSELASELTEIIIVKKKKQGLLKRLTGVRKNKSFLSIIKNNILGLDQKPSLKEIILSFLDHLFCSIQSFVLKLYPNYWKFKYTIEDRRFIRINRIINFLDENSIPYTITDKLNSSTTVDILKRISPDFIVLAGTGVVKKNIIEQASKAVLNCHSSMLPGFRGVNSEHFALLEGKPEFLGHTVHQVTEEIDAGEIYLSKSINYDKVIDNQFSLRYKNINKGVISLIQVIKNFEQITPLNNDISKSFYRSNSSFINTYQLMKKLNEK
jgi:hypothetical protein